MTQLDRRQIAEGLVEGLTYTEIAGRLERPISTITREVIRNGGPGGYQADQAHQATAQRARRRRPTPAPMSPATTPAHGRNPEAVRDLVERFIALMINTGLPRMSARVLTCLYLNDSGSLTAAELVRRLQVSPASISKAVGELEQQQLIRRERDPRRRRDRYVIDADVWVRGWMTSARHNAMMADFAREGAEVLGAVTPAGSRLQDMGQFFWHVGHAMIQAAEQWQKDSSAGRTTAGQYGEATRGKP
ncbi:MarR family transcriptional regulator [Streptosporangium sp. KLBMP 9127]|nr:MarR family transcriptional regulator [Streptosporangium sp. KLBMP 9127]